MADTPDDPAETPIQRALRLKKAAIEARPKPPRGGRFQREQAAAAQSVSSAAESIAPDISGQGIRSEPGAGAQR